MNELAFPSPIPDPISIFLMKIIHERLVIEGDFELSQTVRVEFHTNENGAFGVPVAEYFAGDDTLSDDEKVRLTRQYAPFERSSGTRGYMIDPATGEIVPPNEDGTYPEGSVPEKMMWLTVLASEVPGDTLSEKVMALIVQSMGNMVNNKRI